MTDLTKLIELTFSIYVLQWGLLLGRKRDALWGRPPHRTLAISAATLGTYFLSVALVGWYTPLPYTEWFRFTIVTVVALFLLFRQQKVLDWFLPNRTPAILEALPLAVVVWAVTPAGVSLYSANARARENSAVITGKALEVPSRADDATNIMVERALEAKGPVSSEMEWAGHTWKHTMTPKREGFLVSIYTDITDHKRANEALRRTNEDLEAFAFSASHDLTEPLRNIGQWTGALFEDYGHVLQDPAAVEMQGFITEGVTRMRSLITGLLSFHRAGQVGDMQAVKISEVLGTAIANLENPITESNAAIHIQPDAPQVRGDYSLLVKVFQNIISNSVKYHREGVFPQITITHETLPGTAVIRIEDDGIGVAINQQHKVFKMFGRSSDHLTYKGQGFGLTLVRRLVHEHGGTVDYTSEGTNRGSTVTVHLPLAVNALPTPSITT